MRLFSITAVALLAGCSPSQQEYDQAIKRSTELESQVASLRAELEDVKFGAARLLEQAKAASAAENDGEAKRLLAELIKRHPTSAESRQAAALLALVDARIAAAEQLRKLEQEKKAEEVRVAQERATRNMKKSTDEIRGITWVSHRETPSLGKHLAVYFGTEKNSASTYPLRMKLQYYGDDWLFVRSVTMKADDKVYELGKLEFQRDNSGGSIWEWIDVPVTDYPMLDHLMTAKRVVIRFNGDKYYDDFTLPARQQAQMREVSATWKGMGGKP